MRFDNIRDIFTNTITKDGQKYLRMNKRPFRCVVGILRKRIPKYASGDGPWLGHLERMIDRLCGLSDVLRSPIPGHEFVDALGRVIR